MDNYDVLPLNFYENAENKIIPDKYLKFDEEGVFKFYNVMTNRNDWRFQCYCKLYTFNIIDNKLQIIQNENIQNIERHRAESKNDFFKI